MWQGNESNHLKYYPTSTEQQMFKFNEKAERLNGQIAMLGIMAMFGAYLTTGQIIPGVW
jgi:hypothetical protein